MTAPRIGSTVKVLVYPTYRDYEQRNGTAVEMPAEILSLGPPGVLAWWARVKPLHAPPSGRWLLVRKHPSAPKEGMFYATLDSSAAK